MRICFVTQGALNYYWQEKLDLLSGNDLLIFGYNGLGLVSYKKELSGETEYFRDVANMSKQLGSIIVCGCDTDTYGVFRHSVVIADNGKLLGVSDMAHSIDQSEFVPGGSFRVYDTSKGKIGIVVCEDIFFPETSRVLALCDADILVCVMKNVDNFMPQVMQRAMAYANGVPMALCTNRYVSLVDIRGDVLVSGQNSVINAKLSIEKDYRLINSRRRGIYKDFNSGY